VGLDIRSAPTCRSHLHRFCCELTESFVITSVVRPVVRLGPDVTVPALERILHPCQYGRPGDLPRQILRPRKQRVNCARPSRSSPDGATLGDC
jgi:hypothetical protein